ncbi:MDR family oxidoreductase [Corynebacterium sp. LK2536]
MQFSRGAHNMADMTIWVTRNDDGSVQHSQDSEQSSVNTEGDVVVAVSHSSLNYKDAMALHGDKGVMRTNPLVPGIDVVGTVEESDSERFNPGDQVVCNGDGLGEFRHGGYTDRQRVRAEATVAVPEAFSLAQAAAIGTAGYTAALCVNSLLDHGLSPEDSPRILVTGATGGVGSIAVVLLKQLGFSVTALTGRVEEHGDYLRRLGADEVLDRAEFSETGKPLQKARFAGAVDTAGSHVLANVLAQVTWGGVVASTGMAASPKLETTVLPFILRNVILAGVNSVDAPLDYRQRAWDLLADKLPVEVLDSLTATIGIDKVADAGEALLAGTRHGRTVVEL